jgi:hypothetical protein
MAAFDPTDIVACAMRPTGSWSHMAVLIGFVAATWFASRSSVRRPRPSAVR